jgi:ankyrin repeat protein
LSIAHIGCLCFVRAVAGFNAAEALSPASKRLIDAIKAGDQGRVVDNLDKSTVNASGGANGLSPLHHCSGSDGPPNAQAALAIISMGGNVHTTDNVGETPLHTAAKRGALEVATILINVGLASTMVPTKNGA